MVAFDISKADEAEGSSRGGVGNKREGSSDMDAATLITEIMGTGSAPFTPDMILAEMVKNYRNAERLFGRRLIRAFSGYDAGYVKKNINISEFRKELKKRSRSLTLKMKEEGLVEKGEYTEKALLIAALSMLDDELKRLESLGYGKSNKRFVKEGEFKEYRGFTMNDRFRDMAFKQSIKMMARRGHKTLIPEDLKVKVKDDKEEVDIVLCVDSSASMKGEKIEKAKKAALALAYTTNLRGDSLGIVEFNSRSVGVPPGGSFTDIIKWIASIQARGQTNIAEAMYRAISLLKKENGMKHIIMVTDALATAGQSPVEDALNAVYKIKAEQINLSIIGISLDKEGEKAARKMVEIGSGRLYSLNDASNLDVLLLEEYYSVS